MKIKLKRLKQKLLPNMTNFLCRVHHQDMLYDELKRRMIWRINVLESCDNYDEMFPSKSDVDVERIIFPSRRSLPKVFSTTFPHRFSGSVVFHIIRQGKHKWRIVKKKHKVWKPKKRTVEYDIAKGYFRELGGKWHYMACEDFGCDTCDEQGFCRTGRYCDSFCGIAKSAGFELRGNTWLDVYNEERSLAVLRNRVDGTR